MLRTIETYNFKSSKQYRKRQLHLYNVIDVLAFHSA